MCPGSVVLHHIAAPHLPRLRLFLLFLKKAFQKFLVCLFFAVLGLGEMLYGHSDLLLHFLEHTASLAIADKACQKQR